MFTKAKLIAVVFVLTSAVAHAAETVSGGGEIENFTSIVKTGAVTQMAIGKNNNSELLIGSARADRIKNFTSTVTTGAVTQVAIGTGNTSALLIGSASTR